jgi:cell division protein FtsB
MPRIATIVVFALMLANLQYRLWIGDGGLIDTRRLRAQVVEQQADLTRLHSRNATLEAEVADLKAGGPAIEAYARSTLGMIRPGESFYLIADPAQ